MNSDTYCEEKGAPPGSTAYYRRLFLPRPQQRAVTALFAFCRDVVAIADEVSAIDAARMKLAWWGEEIERLYAGRPRHPVTQALLPHVEERGLQRALFEQFLAGAAMDIDHPGHADRSQLLAQVRHKAAAQRLESEICGYREASTRDFAEQLGIALELVRILRDVRADAQRGRVFIPADRLEAHGVRAGELMQPSTPDHVRALLAEEASRIRERFDRALAALPAIDQEAQCSGLVAAAIQRRLLAEIERDGYRVLQHRIDLTPVRKLWIAWRTVRRAVRTTARQHKAEH